MKLLNPTLSIKNKLSLLVAIAVMLVVTALGFYFDNFLKISSYENAQLRIQHSFQQLAYNLDNFEKNLKDGISFVRNSEQLIASVNLINDYQDKKNYNTYLLDEEKKLIASKLLNRVKFTFNDNIAVYDKNEELIASVSKNNGEYQLSYITYQNNQPILQTRRENEKHYTSGKSISSAVIPYKHIRYYDPSHVVTRSLITYHQLNNKICIQSHLTIYDTSKKMAIGHIEMSRKLDKNYFEQLSKTIGLTIDYHFSQKNNSTIKVISKDTSLNKLNISQSNDLYSASLKQRSFDGWTFYTVNLNKKNINTLLSQSRHQLLIILVLVTISILLLMRFIIIRKLDRPLSSLMKQIEKIELQDYSKSDVVSTGDELEAASVNINQLAEIINQRESSLKRAMLEQEQLSEQIAASEAHLRTLIRTLPDLVWLKDPDGVYLSCNPKFERFFGAREEEIIGKTDYDFVDKDLADSFRKHDVKAMNTGGPTINEEEVTYADDGHKELLETVKTPMLAPDGKLIGILGVGRDITDRRMAEEALRRSQKMDAVGQLTGGIAHDFNNLLGIMLGNIELIQLTFNADEATMNRFESIHKAGKRAANLTKQLLGFSRREPTQKSIIDINKIIENMQELISRSLTPEVEIELSLNDDLWLTELDPGDFEDSLLNLCINARDAMNGHGHLGISTKNTSLEDSHCEQLPDLAAGDYIEISVSDTGEGIPTELQERIFEPFYTTKDQGKGTGLGLAMVYGFIQRSDGCIVCESEVGTGTTFRIYLPRSVTNAEAVVKPSQTISSNDKLSGQETILVVDDEEELLNLARDTLKSHGYHVLTAPDGKQALKILQSNETIDLLFSDVVMPNDINGYELAEKAIALRSDIKILLTSGYTEKIEITDKQSQFAETLLTKPYTQLVLSQQIRLILHI